MLDSDLQKKIEALFVRDNQETFMERIKYTFESERMFEEESDAARYGYTLEHILKNISVWIDEDMQIMGRVTMEIPTEDEVEKILVTYHRWWDMSIEERHKLVLFYYSDGWLKCRPYWFTSFGHLGYDYEQLLEVGYGGLKAKAQERLECTCCNDKQREFLEGVIICLDAFALFSKRYADAAKAAGKEEIGVDLEWISTEAPKTFRQALQLIWLNTLVSQKVAGCGVLNFSRMDKYLNRFYEADIQNGRITKEEALRLIEEFYYRNNEFMEQTDHMSEETSGTADTLELAFDDPNYLTLGGLNADGTSAVCELSYLMLTAANEMRLRNPFIVVRYHDGIEEDFWKLCCESMRNNATVVVYNDDTMIPALKYYNVEEPEVYEYGFWGCNDPDIPGHEGGLRQLWMNMAKPLELALFSGDYPMKPRNPLQEKECQFSLEDRMMGLMIGPYYGIQTKPVEEMTSMEDFMEAFEQQFTYLIGEFRKGFEADLKIEREHTFGKMRIEDCFLKGTIEDAVTWTEGGCKYHKIVTQGSGLATVINSLYVIEEVVFNKKELTLPELAEMMKNNYEGNEEWRLKFKNKYAKFGNDIEAVDKYAKIVTDIFIRAVDANNGSEYLYQMWCTYSTDRAFTLMGEQVGATPDGRLQKEALSENQSPEDGSDLEGVTAMLNSLSKVPFNRITGGPLNLRLHPSAVQGDAGIDIVAALFKTYMQKGGMQLQINVIDVNTLKEAQKNPEKYRSLCVRVTGYSAYFVEMGLKAQNELIARTEHQM